MYIYCTSFLEPSNRKTWESFVKIHLIRNIHHHLRIVSHSWSHVLANTSKKPASQHLLFALLRAVWVCSQLSYTLQSSFSFSLPCTVSVVLILIFAILSLLLLLLPSCVLYAFSSFLLAMHIHYSEPPYWCAEEYGHLQSLLWLSHALFYAHAQ